MSNLKDAFLFNLTAGTHLRDAQHAHKIYTNSNFTFAPKQKYMYHVVFQPNAEVGNSSTANSFLFQKELGILVKSTDLPSFRASVENKQQYNRKKNIQTRLDYQDIRMTLHDDNLGAVRAMLKEYYKYYFADGNRGTSGSQAAYLPRDKYFGDVPNYGLNNKKRTPFFSYITIYQLARRQWFAYTLLNPLLSAWDHGNVDSTDGSFNEASMSVAYEGVLYSEGTVDQNPIVGFGDAEVGYDVEESPLGVIDNALGGEFGAGGLLPALLGAAVNEMFGGGKSFTSNAGAAVVATAAGAVIAAATGGSTGVYTTDTQSDTTVSSATESNSPQLNAAAIIAALNDPATKALLTPALINTGVIPNVDINTYNNATAVEKAAIDQNLINLIQGGNILLIQTASNALAGVA
jgi:hypothetical protein